MKKNIFLALLSIMLLASACQKEKPTPVTELKFILEAPEAAFESTLSDIVVELSEKNTGEKQSFSAPTVEELKVTVPEGLYDITVETKISYKPSSDATEPVEKETKGYSAALVAVGVSVDVKIDLFFYKSSSEGFVISEVFFSGNLTPEGKQTSDQYIKIYNNSADTLYADGLCISESAFMPVDKQDYTPNIMATDFTTSSVIMIPGSGKEYPVYPYKSITIANDAVNYKELNENGIDLSKADFEIIYSNPNMQETDNPDVPNMINVTGLFIFHNRGFRSYVLNRLGKTMEDFVVENKYTYEWVFTFNENSFDMDAEGWKIPNTQILDAVNLSVESEFQWIVTDPSVDMGWTYCGKVDSDDTRYGKSVIRKEAGKALDGSSILMDTNNSALDFQAESHPSLKN